MNLFTPSEPEMFPEPVRGIVQYAITYSQPGWVKYQGTQWAAKFYQPSPRVIIIPGKPVTIVAIQDNTLLVIPSGSDS